MSKRKKTPEKPKISAQDGFSNLFKKRKIKSSPAKANSLIDLTGVEEKENIEEKTAKLSAPKENVRPEAEIKAENPKKDLLDKREDAQEKQSDVEDDSHGKVLSKFFDEMLDDVQNDADKWNLLHDKSQDVLLKIKEMLKKQDVDELLRWYKRKPGWRKPLRLSDHESFQKLIEQKLILTIGKDAEVEFEEMLKLMSKDDLDSIAKTMMIDKKYRKNMETLKAKLLADFKTFTKSNFGAMTPSERLERCVKKKLEGNRFKMDAMTTQAINILFLSYSPTICAANDAGADGQVPGSASIRAYGAPSLGQSMLNNIARYDRFKSHGKLLGVDYSVAPSKLIFSAKDMKKFHEALSIRYQLETLMENKQYEKADELAQSAALLFKKYKKTFPQFYEDQRDLPDYLFRFTTTGVYVRILRFHVEILEKLKEYEDAVNLLKTLLKLNVYKHKRGFWWSRLIINFKHLKRDEKFIMSEVEDALQEKCLSQPQRMDILLRLEKTLKSGVGEKLKGWNTIKEKARKLSTKTGDTQYSGKLWISEVDGGEIIESVELLVLRRLKSRFNFDRGLHSEVSVFSTLLSLILYKDILEPVDGVFQTKYQNGPLDFYSASFYQNRRESIVTRFEQLRGDEFDDILHDIEQLWSKVEQHQDLIGLHHSPDTIDFAQISSLCRCIGGKNLSKILLRLVKNPANRSGMPDLIAWSSAGTHDSYKFCEVKAPGDQLSTAQKCWLKFFIENDISCEVVHVEDAAK